MRKVIITTFTLLAAAGCNSCLVQNSASPLRSPQQNPMVQLPAATTYKDIPNYFFNAEVPATWSVVLNNDALLNKFPKVFDASKATALIAEPIATLDATSNQQQFEVYASTTDATADIAAIDPSLLHSVAIAGTQAYKEDLPGDVKNDSAGALYIVPLPDRSVRTILVLKRGTGDDEYERGFMHFLESMRISN